MATDKNVAQIYPMGVCEVRYNSVNIGHTQGGVDVRMTSHWKEVNVDDYGNSAIDDYERGMGIEVDVPMAQYDVANLKIALPNYEEIVYNQLHFGDKVGDSITKYRLVLDPESANEHAVVVYKAAVTNEIALGFNKEGEKIIQVTFKGYIDESRTIGDRLFRIGGGAS